MQRFKTGDSILILPKFAHLYASNSAVVVSATPDPFRQMFNEYTVRLPEGSTAHLFEFQILENDPNYQTLIAVVLFDSQQQTGARKQTHGRESGRQIILQTSPINIDMTVELSKGGVSVTGHILEKGTRQPVSGAEIRMMKENVVLNTATSDNLGSFKFSGVPTGSLNVLVVISDHFLRIFGNFSI